MSFSDKNSNSCTKKRFSIKDLFSKCDQIRRKLRIWSHLLKKSLIENFNFCAVNIVISRLRCNFAILSERFCENYISLNADKRHFLTQDFNEPFPDFSFDDTTIVNVTEGKILRILFDKKLYFKSPLKSACKKGNQKLSAFSRISILTFLNQNVKSKMLNSFINFSNSYCPLIWIFGSQRCNERINRIHERSFRFPVDTRHRFNVYKTSTRRQ